ncbi:uncharacterized protein [Nicotiana sylvestris]|uniref:uncharacterized protein n=1 Tax=Nicotiana sylvestris TaxID=4096 RepID=UPI00388CA1EC
MAKSPEQDEVMRKFKSLEQSFRNIHGLGNQAPEAPNINQNPLPKHPEAHMIELVHEGGEPKNPSQTVMMIRATPKEESTGGEAEVQVKGEDVKPVVILGKNPSAATRKPEPAKLVITGASSTPAVVVKGVCREPVIIKPVVQLPVIDSKAVPWKYEKVVVMVTFSDDDLPVEGTEHNKALYLTVKCENSAVTRALVDNSSSANICPLSTLNQLKIDHDRIHKNSVCIRGFDGSGTDTVEDIILEVTIGPVEFTMEFQVLDVAVSYNLLLGRPWIHAAKAVPSTLHQMVKFEWDRQDVVLHGEDVACTIGGAIVPFIETNDDKGPWVYQIFDAVSANKIPEGTSIPHPRIASATVMIVSEMLSNGFVPGKGLGAELQGIVQLVSLPKNVETFGLGFKPTLADVRHARKMKKKVWVLPKPVPCLSRSFVRAGTRKLSVPKVLGPIIGPDRDLDEGFERLFAGVNMVEAGEGSSRVDIQFVGPRAKINNWTTTPLPTRWESCSLCTGTNDVACTTDLQPSHNNESNSELIAQDSDYDDESEYEENDDFEEINRELSQFQDKPKPNLSDTEAVNLGDVDNVRETKISIHIEHSIREELIKALIEFKDVFAWSYDDMPANVVPIPKKDGKIMVCIDYRNLNRASPKDNFPLPNIHILIDNCAGREIRSFVDCYAGYHQILMDEEDVEKTAFITP